MKAIRIAFSLAMMPVALAVSAELRQSREPPMIPVGLDAYRMWDRLPYQRIGVRAYMRSTYDREGNNRTADASGFLYQESDTFNVTLDTPGPGVLYFKRTNHWHGSPWHHEIDGNDFIVRETGTADPVNAKKRFSETTFIPAELFPNPLAWTWSITKGADLTWVPLPFEDRLRIAYGRTFYGTGYYIYHLFSPGMENLSRPLTSWDRTPPATDVLELLRRAGTDIAPVGEGVTTIAGTLSLRPREWTTLAELGDAPATVRALKFAVPRDRAYDFGKCRLQHVRLQQSSVRRRARQDPAPGHHEQSPLARRGVPDPAPLDAGCEAAGDQTGACAQHPGTVSRAFLPGGIGLERIALLAILLQNADGETALTKEGAGAFTGSMGQRR
ncbi:MAG: hypothetical protein JW741_08660 [Sedimentisphaerales bacterium]|nr:hypothetical protein [Sedimentisphaerales bacterium]